MATEVKDLDERTAETGAKALKEIHEAAMEITTIAAKYRSQFSEEDQTAYGECAAKIVMGSINLLGIMATERGKGEK